MPILSALNYYNAGDLITMLPGLQKLHQETGQKVTIYQKLDFPAFYYAGAEHPVKDKEGQQVCVNQSMFTMLKPLLEAQEYIESYLVWQGEKVDLDFSATRDSKRVPLPYGNIHHWVFMIFPELACDLSHEWLLPAHDEKGQVIDSYKELMAGRVVINRTSRYTNPYIHYYFLKKYENKLVFAGTEEERLDFCEKWGLSIPKLHCYDFYELATMIYCADGFIGNQSLCWHLADAMKVPRVLEYCPMYPNTHPTGANGYAAVYQEALELYIEKMFNHE